MSSPPVIGQPRLGFFGKLPSNGDFVTRRLPRAFTNTWDDWLQNAIADSRERLGDTWLDSYLVSPIWRFVISGGLCGQTPWCGVLMPSVDRVGRYFPLTVATSLDQGSDPLSMVYQADQWFCNCENLSLAVLNDELDLTAFDEGLLALPTPIPQPRIRFDAPRSPDVPMSWEIPLPPEGMRESFADTLADMLLRHVFPVYSLWWTRDTQETGHSVLIAQGLPAASRFAAMLDGNWSAWGWDVCRTLATDAKDVAAQSS